MKNALVNLYNKVDGFVKFPNLRKGDTGVQIGFDLSSKNPTTELLKMCYRVGKEGRVIGIDPDPHNHAKISEVLKDLPFRVTLVQKGTYKQKDKLSLLIAERSSWNRLSVFNASEDSEYIQLDKYSAEASKKKVQREIEVELDKLDNILEGIDCDFDRLRHINITNNGAEYDTLLGMRQTLEKSKDLCVTMIAGRPKTIDGLPDHAVFVKLFKEQGYFAKFYTKASLFWWGFVHLLLLKRQWIYGKKEEFGIVIASKRQGVKRWYQGFS